MPKTQVQSLHFLSLMWIRLLLLFLALNIAARAEHEAAPSQDLIDPSFLPRAIAPINPLPQGRDWNLTYPIKSSETVRESTYHVPLFETVVRQAGSKASRFQIARGVQQYKAITRTQDIFHFDYDRIRAYLRSQKMTTIFSNKPLTYNQMTSYLRRGYKAISLPYMMVFQQLDEKGLPVVSHDAGMGTRVMTESSFNSVLSAQRDRKFILVKPKVGNWK